jgi:hypothetical protein
MLFWNGSLSAWVKVAAGTDGQTLTFIGGRPVWSGSLPANTVVNSTTGKIWMDRNLGATQVATSSTDALAYGSLFQWGRGADNHELITWTTTTAGTPVNAATAGTSSSTTPGSSFLYGSSNWYTGLANPDNFWQGVSGTNNPCPTGYRIPTEAEWEAERLSWTSNNSVGAFASPLKLPMAGFRYSSNGSLGNVGAYGGYWSNTVSGTAARRLFFDSSSAVMLTSNRALGASVRCLMD